MLIASICVEMQGTNETGQFKELPEAFELFIFYALGVSLED